MNNEEDYYARRMKKADAALPHIMRGGMIVLLVSILTNLL